MADISVVSTSGIARRGLLAHGGAHWHRHEPWTLPRVIAWRFKVNGSTGSIIRALNDDGFVKLFSAAGLVE